MSVTESIDTAPRGLRHRLATSVWTARLAHAVPLLPVALSMLVMGIALLPEVTVGIPSLNDNAAHYALIQNADRAIAAGLNPVDHWAADLELGYPQFAYYQHLPHLFVVVLERLTLGQADLLTLFNLTRYVLMVGFPVTVYWSLRQLGFSRPAAGTAAALAPLLSAGHRFGLEYDSYVWRGFGMYTQLWGQHLAFITLALAHRTMRDGKGYLLGVIAIAALVLSHVIYAFVTAILLGILLLAGATRENFVQRTRRLLLMGLPAVVVSAYFWLPLILNGAYHTSSPYMEDWKYDSFGASQVLSWLATGELLDHNRPPVITALGGIGVLVALWTRTRLALLALAVFAFWLVAYFGRPTLGPVADLLSFDGKLWMHRYLGPVQIGAIMLVAVAAGGLWTGLHRIRRLPWPIAVFGVLVLAVTITALSERWLYLDRNRVWMNETQQMLAADTAMHEIIEVLQAAPPGRVYAGARSGFSEDMKTGSLRVADILLFHEIETAAPPYQSLSLNSDLVWHVDYADRTYYRVLNIRYAILPPGLPPPAFLTPILETERYVLYEAPATGYIDLAETPAGFEGSDAAFHVASRGWFLGRAARDGVHPAFAFAGTPRLAHLDYGDMEDAPAAIRRMRATTDSLGSVSNEAQGPDAYETTVRMEEAGTAYLKTTYHPDWRAYVNGERVTPYMVAPSFPGIWLEPGEYDVRFEYRPASIRMPLVLLGAMTLGVVALGEFGPRLRRRMERGPRRPHDPTNQPG